MRALCLDQPVLIDENTTLRLDEFQLRLHQEPCILSCYDGVNLRF